LLAPDLAAFSRPSRVNIAISRAREVNLAESLSGNAPGKLGRGSSHAMDMIKLHSVEVLSAGKLIELDKLRELERLQAFAFSACTFDIDGRRVIVYNPLRSRPRRRSDIAHELSHLLLNHELTEIREVAGVPFRTCRSDQEEEATNLGGTLLLPRQLLLKAATKGMDIEDVAQKFNVTTEMARFRINTTGVFRQLERARAKRAT
jgi:Zn-dependent peptidase ImmA (M78 family)